MCTVSQWSAFLSAKSTAPQGWGSWCEDVAALCSSGRPSKHQMTALQVGQMLRNANPSTSQRSERVMKAFTGPETGLKVRRVLAEGTKLYPGMLKMEMERNIELKETWNQRTKAVGDEEDMEGVQHNLFSALYCPKSQLDQRPYGRPCPSCPSQLIPEHSAAFSDFLQTSVGRARPCTLTTCPISFFSDLRLGLPAAYLVFISVVLTTALGTLEDPNNHLLNH